MKLLTMATCNLNQWALDFEGNLTRIVTSIEAAKNQGARLRLGPELEITGYGCEDAFLEEDTFLHAWECVVEILKSDLTEGILCDVGMPVMHKNVRYNCRVVLLERKILLIRPKMILAADGNYREPRWFVPWQHARRVQEYYLPRMVRGVTGQTTIPFGEAAIATTDTVLASETCEELFAPHSRHIDLALDGVEVITNGSGSHHELRKLQKRVDLVVSATAKAGGVYLYANQQGCDGGRLYFDGCALIAVNGHIIAQSSQFSPREVEVVTATIDLEEVRSYRGSVMSRMLQASQAEQVPRVSVDFSLTAGDLRAAPVAPKTVRFHDVEEEIAYGPACWLWDYLRRSGAAGFFLPLSGGADSSAVAAIIGSMCQMVTREARNGNNTVVDDARRVLGDETYMPSDAREFAHRVLHTCYMGTEHSSQETCERATRIAEEIGSYHISVNIDNPVEAFTALFVKTTSKTPRFNVEGGSNAEDRALQNVQARVRMVYSYMLARLLPWIRGKEGTLLVLGTSNVDESLRGYMTKYDNSSADINPIGSISKLDLQRFLRWAAENLGYESLLDAAEAVPSAELVPRTDTFVQRDEIDMGMTYEELSRFGRLRKVERCGPVSMFEKLVHERRDLQPREVAEKVKRFFYHYAANRHKMTVLTPAYHAESYSPDDNRFDLRQFLYNTQWSWQFRKIDQLVEEMEQAAKR